MGCLGSKNSAAKASPDRRRLSVSQAQAVTSSPDNEKRGRVAQTTGANILDLFPESGRRLSVQGKPSEGSQKGFDNKNVQTVGNAELAVEANVGVACKKGLKPESPNQDDFFIMRVDDWGMYAVFDGHGPFGHDISNFCNANLPSFLVRDPEFNRDLKKAFVSAFKRTHAACEVNSSKGRFDASLSGTTSTVIVHRDNKIWTAWAGDSRAVMAKTEGGKLVAVELSTDHKPDRPDEKVRIHANGGQVKRLDGDIPYRVFLKGKLYPGLAMTRSIGDTVGNQAGVTPEPDVRMVEVTPNAKSGDLLYKSRFFVLCSDGVWEFISNEEAVEIIDRFSANEVQKACETLAQEAWKRWLEEEGNVVDDITVIVVHLK